MSKLFKLLIFTLNLSSDRLPTPYKGLVVTMLKSTHKPQIESSPLPQGWTEHKAPSGECPLLLPAQIDLRNVQTLAKSPCFLGHTYYYHAASATSTYTRPTAPAIPQPQPAIVPSPDPTFAAQPFNYANAPLGQLTNPTSNGFGNYRGGDSHGPSHIHHRPRPEDRPKSKVAIPGCSPWVLVRTKLGRRFVHNLDSGESFWKFPSEVLRRVVELDRKERERKERRERGEPSESEKEEDKVEAEEDDKGYDSDEYEEVEVTDDEGDDGANKRPRIEQANEEPNGPVEFNEDDFAYQLAAMGQGEADYGEEGWDEGFDEPPLEEDSKALFRDLLNDFYINPYTPWEKVVEHGAIIEDNRYLCLPNMKSRREVFDNWSRDKMQELKERRERQEKKDPRIAYFAFLEKYATPKLYWPEFKRKYKKEPEMRNTKIQDKDQEKAYREYINRE